MLLEENNGGRVTVATQNLSPQVLWFSAAQLSELLLQDINNSWPIRTFPT